jgi:hypothetical protein
VIWIEKNANDIVTIDCFAASHARADQLRMIVEADEDNVEVFVIPSDIRFRALRHRLAIFGIALEESGNLGHPGDRVLRWIHAEEIVKDWRTSHVRNLQSCLGNGWGLRENNGGKRCCEQSYEERPSRLVKHRFFYTRDRPGPFR